MTPCKAERYLGNTLLVTFNDGKSLLLQSDIDIASFFYSNGLIATESPFDPNYSEVNAYDINECLDDYYSIATYNR